MRLAPSSLRPRLAPASSSSSNTQARRSAAPAAAAAANRRRRSLAVSAQQQQATDARDAIDAGIDLMQAGDARAALAEFGRALTLPGTGLKRYRCVQCSRIRQKARERESGMQKKQVEKKKASQLQNKTQPPPPPPLLSQLTSTTGTSPRR